MSEEHTNEELFKPEMEQEEKEHDHHNPTVAAMTNHIISSQGILKLNCTTFNGFRSKTCNTR